MRGRERRREGGRGRGREGGEEGGRRKGHYKMLDKCCNVTIIIIILRDSPTNNY